MDEKKVRDAYADLYRAHSGKPLNIGAMLGVTNAIKEAIEPLEEQLEALKASRVDMGASIYNFADRITALEGTQKKFWDRHVDLDNRVFSAVNRLDEQEDVDIEIDDRVYYLEKCVHALEDRLEVLEDCESALPGQEKQQYKHEEYGVWHCDCGKRTFGTLPNYCSDCGKRR